MNKQHILRLTLFVSVLVMNPAVAQVNLRTGTKSTALQNIQEQQNIQEEIAATLEAKGLEAEAAQKLSHGVIGENGKHFAEMVANLEKSSILTKEGILSYLGNAALFRKQPDLASYDTLLHIAMETMKRTPDSRVKAELKRVARINRTLTV
jgi:hypothetical protein